ncbi:MAG: hypothetical protein ACPGVK_10995 [Halocynthiibacter sp.]
MKFSSIHILILFLLLPLQGLAQGCFQNMLPNGSFEGGLHGGVPIEDLPHGLSNSEQLAGGWYNAGATVDVNQVGDGNYRGFSPTADAVDGTQWLTLYSNSYQKEAIAVTMDVPVQAGKNYRVSFYAAVSNSNGGKNKKTKMRVYISDRTSELSWDDRNGYERVGTQKVKGLGWTRYSFDFKADSNATQFMIGNRNPAGKGRIVALDQVVMTSLDDECEPTVCGPGVNNLVQDPGFEKPSDMSPWGYIFHTHTNRRTSASDTSNSFMNTKTPVDATYSSDNGNTHWMVLNSLERPGACFWCNSFNEANGAVVVKLKSPTIPGQTYRLSFMGATANPWSRKPAHVNVGLSHTPHCGGACSGADWVTDIPVEQAIYDNKKLDQKPKTWALYHKDFAASGDYQYLTIQAQDGVEPALDDVCLTADPFLTYLEPAKLYYTTNTAVHHVDDAKVDTTVAHDASYDLFGLERHGSKVIASDNQLGFLKVEAQYPSPQLNTVTHINGSNLATDMVLAMNGQAYFAADYKIFKIPNLANASSQSPLAAAWNLTAPFSLAYSENYLFSAGRNQIAITNLLTHQSQVIQGHGINMAGFMDLGDDGRLYIADPAADAVRVVAAPQLAALKAQLDANMVVTVGAFSTLSAGGLLDDALQGAGDHAIRGPIGVDHKEDTVWVTVDQGSNATGRIVAIDANSAQQSLYLDGIDAPRDIVVWK